MGQDIIQVKLSEDGRVGLLTINAPPENYPSIEEIQSKIAKAHWSLKINQTLLEKLVSAHRSTQDQIITQIDFNDESFIWYIDKPSQLALHREEDGRINFKQIHEFQSVSEGQKLLSVLPPDNPQSPSQTTSKTILHYLAGRNTTVSDDGLTVYANKNGHVFLRENKIIIDNIYHIEGDVDYTTGNVKFDGVILIEGDVRSGFRVDASESIIINGMVEAASVYSRNGDISIKHGIMGKNRAKILAGGNLKCSFVQNANLSARKDVLIEKYAINSTILSGGKIFVNTNEGMIWGGKVLAEDGIHVKIAGNERRTETEIGLTGFQNISIDSRRKSLQNEYAELHKRLLALEKQVEFFNLLKERLNGLTPQKENERTQSLKDIEMVKTELAGLEQKLASLEKMDTSIHRVKCINVFDTVYSGVTVSMGTVKEYIGIPEKKVRFYLEGDTIEKESLE